MFYNFWVLGVSAFSGIIFTMYGKNTYTRSFGLLWLITCIYTAFTILGN